MSGPFYVELENNHHYILVNEQTGRSYYTPAQADAHEICGIINRLIKSGRKITYEIKRTFPDRRDEHVAFVTNEDLALEFCDKHSDCYYHPLIITKYANELEGLRNSVPCCDSCDNSETRFKNNGNKGLFCKEIEDFVDETEYCEDWEPDL